MTYPPQGPTGYQVPYQAQPAPERPQQVLTAAILMFAIGVIGVLMIVALVTDTALLAGNVSGFGIAGCLGPALHIAVGVLAIFVLRGQHGPRVAVYVVGGIAAICDGFASVMSLVTSSELAGYTDTGSGVLVFMAVITALVMAANVTAITLLATGRANAWFNAMKGPRPIYPPHWS